MQLYTALVRYVRDVRQTRTQTYFFIIAVWFVTNVVTGILVSPSALSFGAGHHLMSCTVMVFGFIPLTANGWHGLFHLITAMAAFTAARKPKRAALLFGLIAGQIYLIVAGLGFMGGDNVLGLLTVDTSGNFVHTIEGLAMLLPVATALASNRQPVAEPLTKARA